MTKIFTIVATLCLVFALGACSSTTNTGLTDEPSRGVSTTYYNVTSEWNYVCAAHNFLPKTAGRTFAQGYFGSDFATDWVNVRVAMRNRWLATHPMGTGPAQGAGSGNDVMSTGPAQGAGTGNDVMSVLIEAWPGNN